MPHFFDGRGPRDPAPDEPGAIALDIDGAPWSAVFRHEMTRLARGTPQERGLLVHFFGPGGAHRVVPAPNDLADHATVADLVRLWRAGH